MRGQLILIFLGLFYTTNCFSQSDLDSLERIIHSKEGIERVILLNQIANNYITKDINITAILAEESYKLADKSGYKSGKAKAANILGLINYFRDQLNQAEYYCTLAQKIAKNLKDQSLERDVNTNLALIFIDDSAYEKCIVLYERNVIIDLNLKRTSNLSMDYQNLGKVYELSGKNDLSINYFKKALIQIIAVGNSERLKKVYCYIGRQYININPDSAKHYLVLSTRVPGINMSEDFFEIYCAYSELYQRIGLPDSSNFYLKLASGMAKNSSNSRELLNHYKKKYIAYASNRDFRNAYLYQTLYIQLQDSSNIPDSSEDLSAKLVKIEEENRLQTIELLKKEAQINDGDWLTRKVIYFLIFGGISLITFVFISFYFRYKLFKKSILLTEKLKNDIVSLTADLSKGDETIAELKRSEEKLKKRNKAFLNSFLGNQIESEIDVAYNIKKELEAFTIKLNSDRSGLFIFDNNQRLSLLGEFDRSNPKTIFNRELNKVGFPFYFETINDLKPVISNNCRTDPRYIELKETQVGDPGKISRIDIPISIERKLLGVLYVERVNPESNWKESEIEHAREISEELLPQLCRSLSIDSLNMNDFIQDTKIISSLFNRLDLLLIEKNREGIIFQIYPYNSEKNGVSFKNNIRHNWINIVDVPDRNSLLSFYSSIKGDPLQPGNLNYSIILTPGNLIYINEEVIKLATVNNEERIISAIFLNNFQNREKELKLRVNSLRAVISAFSRGILVCDNNGKILLINPYGEKITGYKSIELLSKPISNIIKEEWKVLNKSGLESNFKSMNFITNGGGNIKCEVSIASFIIEGSGYFILDFISEEKQQYHDTPISITGGSILDYISSQSLYLLLQYQVRFFSFLLKDSQNNLSGELDILYFKIREAIRDKGEDYNQSKKELHNILSRLNSGLNEDLSQERRIDFTEIFNFERYNRTELIEYDIDYALRFLFDRFIAHRQESHIIHLELTFRGRLYCIPAEILFAVYEVIKNGIESGRGNLDIYVKTQELNDKLIISVTDTGEGIIPEMKKKLFEPSTSTRNDHQGYGLFFVKQFIDFHSGEIKIRSKLNKGTEIVIEIPIYVKV